MKTGKLTKEEAAAKLTYLKKSQDEKKAEGKKQSDYEAIEAAVKAGKLTKEEAAAKLAALKKAQDEKKAGGKAEKKPKE